MKLQLLIFMSKAGSRHARDRRQENSHQRNSQTIIPEPPFHRRPPVTHLNVNNGQPMN
jgi:hypothetical protein